MSGEEKDVIELTSCDEARFQRVKLTWLIKRYKKRLTFARGAKESYHQSDMYTISIPTESPYQERSIKLCFQLMLFWNWDRGVAAADNNEDGEEEEEEERPGNMGLFLQYLPTFSSMQEVILNFEKLINSETHLS